jgi:hypothetical protein
MQATGQYYYQAADGDTMTVVSAASATPMASTSDGRKSINVFRNLEIIHLPVRFQMSIQFQ